MSELSLHEKFKQLLVRKGIKYVLKFSGLIFKRARSKEENEQVFSIRYQLYAEAGYIDPMQYPNKLLTDKYDASATNLLVLDKDKPIGTARLIFNSATGFPIEKLYNFDAPKISRHNLAEISRLAIARPYRGGSRAAMLGLMKMMYEGAKENNITHFYAFMPERLERSLKSFGLSFFVLNERPLLESHLKERQALPGYFLKNVTKPYILSVKETSTLFGL